MSILVDRASDTEHGNRIWFHPDNYVHPCWLGIRHWAWKHWRPVLGATACHFVRADLKYIILLNSAILLKKYLSFVLDCIIMVYIFFAFRVRVTGVYWNHHVSVFVSVSPCVLRFTVDSTIWARQPFETKLVFVCVCASLCMSLFVSVADMSLFVCVCCRHTVSVADMSLFVSVADILCLLQTCHCLCLLQICHCLCLLQICHCLCLLQMCHYLCLLQTLKWRVQNTRV